MPVRTTLFSPPAGRPRVFSKEVAMRITREASSRLARPRMAFCSWMAPRNPPKPAASMVGTEA